MRYLLLALLAAFSLSAMAGKPTKEQTTGEQTPQGADTCESSNGRPDTQRQRQGAQTQHECKTFNESRSNSLRAAPKAKEGATGRKPAEVGIAISDPGVPSDKATGAKK